MERNIFISVRSLTIPTSSKTLWQTLFIFRSWVIRATGKGKVSITFGKNI